MNKILGIIPARQGSKGIPNKNKKTLHHKPLIAYTLEAAGQSNLDDLVVSTDDIEIMKLCETYGVRVIERPDTLAQDNTPTLPVLAHVVDSLSDSFDAVMTLQPTSPFRTTSHINEAIDLFNQNQSADSLVSVVSVPHQYVPESVMIQDGDYVVPLDKQNLLRRQDKPIYYARNGAAIYITKSSKLSEYVFGGKILPYHMSKLDSLDIDDADDWELAEALMTFRHNPH